jgi:xanthine dehydrogenase molybdenum-binding subunit
MEAGDTEACPWNHGAYASNTAHRSGFATWAASVDARRQILELAAQHYLKGDPEDLDIKDGIIYSKGNPDEKIPLAKMLSDLMPDTLSQPIIVGRPTLKMPPSQSHTKHFAAHFVEVEVDDETGEIKLVDYVATQDSGTVLNPKVLKNQIIGGAIAGAGFALFEALAFDRQTGKILNPNFLDYKVLRAPDFPAQPRFFFGHTYDPAGAYGAKGGGEGPIAAATPAVCQAVYNAIGAWLDIPMSPERVLKALGRI